MVKNPPANAGDTRDVGSIAGSGISSGGGHGNSLQYSCLENSMDRAACCAIVHWATKSWTQLSEHKTHTNLLIIIKKEYTFLLIRFNSRCLDGIKKEHNNMIHVSLHVILQTSCGNRVYACMCLYIYTYIQREREKIYVYIYVCI